MPPVFLQDLTNGTFSNSEQQDLFFVKHLVGQWSQTFEEECNLKLFGQRNGGRYVEHNLDGLLRGDYATRMTGHAAASRTRSARPTKSARWRTFRRFRRATNCLFKARRSRLGSQPITGRHRCGTRGNRQWSVGRLRLRLNFARAIRAKRLLAMRLFSTRSPTLGAVPRNHRARSVQRNLVRRHPRAGRSRQRPGDRTHQGWHAPLDRGRSRAWPSKSTFPTQRMAATWPFH
jgi:hypothetical protein